MQLNIDHRDLGINKIQQGLNFRLMERGSIFQSIETSLQNIQLIGFAFSLLIRRSQHIYRLLLADSLIRSSPIDPTKTLN